MKWRWKDIPLKGRFIRVCFNGGGRCRSFICKTDAQPCPEEATYLIKAEWDKAKPRAVKITPHPYGSSNLRRNAVVPENITDVLDKTGYGNVDAFTYEEMSLATKKFHPGDVLGEGGFGIVYKGVIDSNVRPAYEAVQVAVKKLNPEGFQGDREWLTEVNYLGKLHHPNLVKLFGCCSEGDHRMLVYEYMANGSLEKHIVRRVGATLSWSKRMKIALDAAKGLAFLHGVERPIIY